jgi:hypothetical protein
MCFAVHVCVQRPFTRVVWGAEKRSLKGVVDRALVGGDPIDRVMDEEKI